MQCAKRTMAVRGFRRNVHIRGRAEIAANLKALPQPTFKGRPTKRDRRDIERFEDNYRTAAKKSVWGDFE